MKDSEEFNVNIYIKIYLFSEITDKLKVIIRYNEIKNIIFLIKFCKPDTIYTDSINFSHKYEYDIFKKVIYNNYHINADFFININE